ncbi:hypothetical protein DSECCO2_546000 [anaerobic digester metagenome]
MARKPGLPPLVKMASRSPFSGLARASVSTVSNMASMSATRSMPARRKAASYTSSAPSSMPECAAAADAAASDRPALMTSTGLLRASARAADMKRRALSMVSMYSSTARVFTSLFR